MQLFRTKYMPLFLKCYEIIIFVAMIDQATIQSDDTEDF